MDPKGHPVQRNWPLLFGFSFAAEYTARPWFSLKGVFKQKWLQRISTMASASCGCTEHHVNTDSSLLTSAILAGVLRRFFPRACLLEGPHFGALFRATIGLFSLRTHQEEPCRQSPPERRKEPLGCTGGQAVGENKLAWF